MKSKLPLKHRTLLQNLLREQLNPTSTRLPAIDISPQIGKDRTSSRDYDQDKSQLHDWQQPE